MNPWILAARAKTLPASISPVIIGLALSGIKYPLVAALTLLSATLLQIASNVANDYYDCVNSIDSSERLGPIRVTEQGLLSKSDMKRGLFTIFSLALVAGIYLMYIGGTPIIIIGTSSLLFAYLYTGGPYPLSYYALGEILAFIFFGPVAVLGTYYLQTLSIDLKAIVFSIGIGFISSAIMSINNLRDIESDRASKKNTIASIIGSNRARYFTLTLLLLSSAVALISAFIWSWWFILPAISVITFKDFKKLMSGKIDSELNMTLARCGRYMFIYSIAIAIALYLSKL